MKYLEVTFHINAPTQSVADACDLMAAAAGETGFETFEETADGLKGYVQEALFDRKALDAAIRELPINGTTVTYEVSDAEYKDWNESWEQEGFEPIIIGDRCIIHDGCHLPTEHAAVEVEIDARLAFGTGNHETTRMLIRQLVESDLQGKTFLDAGCGTGILGIVALKCGAASATGYDIDEWSIDNTRHNAVINHVADRYKAMLGNASILDGIGKTFDIIAANINRNILLADMPNFVKALKTRGKLLLGGFYNIDAPVLASAATKLGLRQSHSDNDGDWAFLTFTKL